MDAFVVYMIKNYLKRYFNSCKQIYVVNCMPTIFHERSIKHSLIFMCEY